MSTGSGTTKQSVILTHRFIESLKAGGSPYRVPDQRCGGLAVRVAPNGGKTWDLAYRITGAGRVRRLSLGRVQDVPLESARRRANELTSAARGGRDLLDEELRTKLEEARRLSVEQLIDLYCRRRVDGRLRTGGEIRKRLLRSLDPVLQRTAVELRRRDIRPLLDQVAESGTVREAEKRRQTIGAMFRWSLSQDLVELDPTAGLTSYDTGVLKDRILSEEELPIVWRWAVSGAISAEAADVLRLQILTGARCGEVCGMRVDEFDRETWLWTLPAERSKNKKQRLTPIVGMAREIVQARLEGVSEGALFRTERGTTLRSVNMGQCLWSRRECLPVPKFTTHDLRRTVATALVDMGYPLDLVAAVIGHEAGGKETRTLMRHYVRTEQVVRKAHVLTAWDAKVDELVFGKRDSVVHPLRQIGGR
jgi:integrase